MSDIFSTLRKGFDPDAPENELKLEDEVTTTSEPDEENEEEEQEEETLGEEETPAEEASDKPKPAQEIPAETVLRTKLNQIEKDLIPKFTKQLETIKSENETLRAQVEAYKQLESSVAQYGLSPQDAAVGLSIARGLRDDPVKTMQNLAAALAQKGIKFDAVPTFDYNIVTNVVGKLLEEKLSPLMTRIEQYSKQEQEEKALEQEYERFFSANPIAVPHKELLLSILQQRPDLGLTGAWEAVQKWALENNRDLLRVPKKPVATPRTYTAPAKQVKEAESAFNPLSSWDEIFRAVRPDGEMR